jgi:hypothetical protein
MFREGEESAPHLGCSSTYMAWIWRRPRSARTKASQFRSPHFLFPYRDSLDINQNIYKQYQRLTRPGNPGYNAAIRLLILLAFPVRTLTSGEILGAVNPLSRQGELGDFRTNHRWPGRYSDRTHMISKPSDNYMPPLVTHKRPTQLSNTPRCSFPFRFSSKGRVPRADQVRRSSLAKGAPEG